MSRKIFGENYLSAILLVIQLFPREPDLVKCCERSGGLADIAALATWFLFGKLFGVATLVDFGEKRCRKAKLGECSWHDYYRSRITSAQACDEVRIGHDANTM